MDIHMPQRSWREYRDSLPKSNHNPNRWDLTQRWATRSGAGLPGDDGERNMYRALVLGCMEPEEAEYVQSRLAGLMTEPMLMTAVMVLRDLVQRVEKLEQAQWAVGQAAPSSATSYSGGGSDDTER